MAVIKMETVDQYIKNIEFEIDSTLVPKDYLNKTSRDLMVWVYEQATKLGVKEEVQDEVLSEYRTIEIDGLTVAGSAIEDGELTFPTLIREDVEDLSGKRLTEHQWEAVRNEIEGRFKVFLQELVPNIVADVFGE